MSLVGSKTTPALTDLLLTHHKDSIFIYRQRESRGGAIGGKAGHLPRGPEPSRIGGGDLSRLLLPRPSVQLFCH